MKKKVVMFVDENTFIDNYGEPLNWDLQSLFKKSFLPTTFTQACCSEKKSHF